MDYGIYSADAAPPAFDGGAAAAKTQSRIMAAIMAFFITALSACAYLAMAAADARVRETGNGDAPQKEPFDLSKPFEPRDARTGAGGIEWEINFGGGGEDEIRRVFDINGEFYAFGDTDSTDGDFKGNPEGSLFAAILDGNGRIKAVATFGDGGDKFKDAYFAAETASFLILADKKDGGFTACETNLELNVTRSFSRRNGARERGLKIFAGGGGADILFEREDEYTGATALGLVSLNRALDSATYARIASFSGSFKFTEAYAAHGAITVLCECAAAGAAYPALISFDRVNEPRLDVLKYRPDTALRALAGVPASDGGLLVFTADGGENNAGSVIKIKYETDGYRFASETFPNLTDCAGGKFFWKNNDERFLTVERGDKSGAARIITDAGSAVSHKTPAAAPPGGALDCARNGEIFAFLSNGGAAEKLTDVRLTVLTESANKFTKIYEKDFGGDGAERGAAVFATGGGFMIFSNSTSQSGGPGDNFGKSDAWAFFVKVA